MSENDHAVEVEVRVVVPEEPPVVTVGAVRVLLRIVRAAAVRIDERDEVEREAA
ncbi:MAG: hypothetical protein ACRDRK_26915 [Pseudonocardia sp.]